jgi:hypothetical protein
MWQAADQAYRFAHAKSVAVIELEANGCFPFVFDVSRLSLASSQVLDRCSSFVVSVVDFR